MLTSEEYTIQDNTKIDGKIINAGELDAKEQYLCSMQLDTNCYWNQHPHQNSIIVPTHKILHP